MNDLKINASPAASTALTPLKSERSPRRRRPDQFLQHSAEEQLRILTAVRAALEVHHHDLEDDGLMFVLAEGETDLFEVMDLILEADMHDEALIAGLKTQKDTLAVRLHRLQQRRDSRRSILEQALMLLECKSLERPVATLTLSERAPSLIVEEEAQIPSRFFDLKPALNRRLTKEALEAGEQVPGARLSNGAVTLTIRRR